jgi:hypothetical protein
MRYGRVIDGVVIEIIPTEATKPLPGWTGIAEGIPSIARWYNDDFAKDCREVPYNVEQGWIYSDETRVFEPPLDGAPLTLKQVRAYKVAELMNLTEQRIFTGIDVTTPTFGTLHYPLTDRDQGDLSFFNELVASGKATGWLYNAQGQDHEFYPIEDLAIICNTCSFFITQTRTLFSTIRKWVERETDVGVINSITLVVPLPEDLQQEYEMKMGELMQAVGMGGTT